MAKIPLRTYNREIERMIDQGQSKQAIIHCRHILKYYPKHIDTYRLLGKAYLEIQRYADASDVLQRVLSTVPDDFISNIGLSIIREDEVNLDAAIWHMERAFEAQPSNNTVRDELRRLYGRRDGVEPPKIRLTRGALVRMYARGELFQQAIAEIRVALAEDPQRFDLEVILARMYYLSGQTVLATEVCSRLIAKLPYSFEANRILAEILPTTSRAEDAINCQQRIYAMDPYLSFLPPTASSSADVPDDAVTLDPLDYDLVEEELDVVSEWTKTIGVEMGEDHEALPDWFKTTQPKKDQDQPPLGLADIKETDEDPDIQEKSIQEVDNLLSNETKEEPIPEWMRQAGWSASSGEPGEHESELVLALEEHEQTIEPAEIPEWLRAEAPITVRDGEKSPDPVDFRIIEDRMSDLAQMAEIQEELEPSELDTFSPEGSTTLDEVIPDWLEETDLETLQPPEGNAEQSSLESIEETQPVRPSMTPKSEDFNSAQLDIDQAMSWLETLAARQGADSETLLTSPEERTDIPPDWIQNLTTQENRVQSEQIQTEGESPTITDSFDEKPTPFEDALEQEPIGGLVGDTRDWLSEISPMETSEELASLEFEETSPFLEADLEFIPAFEPTHTDDQKPQETLQEGKLEGEEIIPGEHPLDWLAETDNETEQREEELEQQTTVTQGMSFDPEIPEWLFNAQIEAGDDLDTSHETANGSIEMDLPDWLDEKEQPSEETAPTGFIVGVDVPEWLKEELGTQVVVSQQTEQEMAPIQEITHPFESSEEKTPTPSEVRQEDETPPFTEPTEGLDPDSASSWLEEPVHQDTFEESQFVPADEGMELPPEWVSQPSDAAESEPVEGVRLTTELESDPTPKLIFTDKYGEPFQPDHLKIGNLRMEEDLPELISPPVFSMERTQDAEKSAETLAEDAIPEWLAEFDIEKTAVESVKTEISEEIPEWLRDLEKEQASQPEVTIASEWVTEFESPTTETAAERPTITPPPNQEEHLTSVQTLKTAQAALEAYNVDRALEYYNHLVQNGQHLEDIIHDLRDALYRYPIDIGIWQSLGDAYMRSNRLQEALDAYTKAEELLR